jgi:uncharacterized membrane protein YuzA (DUF378 family)
MLISYHIRIISVMTSLGMLNWSVKSMTAVNIVEIVIGLNLQKYSTMDAMLSVYMIVSISYNIYANYIRLCQPHMIESSTYLANMIFKIFPKPINPFLLDAPNNYTKWYTFVFCIKQLLYVIGMLIVVIIEAIIVYIIARLFENAVCGLYCMLHDRSWEFQAQIYILVTMYNYIEADKWYRVNRRYFVRGYTVTTQIMDDNCAICYQPMIQDISKINSCTHTFHTECISSWYNISPFCPICRQ